MTRIDIEQLKRRHPIAEVVRRHGVELRGRGRRLTGRCPFHEDRTPSFCVYPETESFHCFGCGASGDVIDFVRRTEDLGFREAALRLGGGAANGTTVATPPPPPRTRVPEEADRAPALSLDDRLILTAACELYHETLLETPEALRYLDERGVQPWLRERCRLGASDGRSLVPYLKRRRLSLKRAGELGLLFPSGDETMAGRIVVPELRGAHCGWMVGRAPDGGPGPKYRGLSLPKPLLGHEPGRRRLFLTEGPFDWLTLTGWGLAACALLGTQPGRGALRLLERARSVVLVMDSDEAGRDAARKLAGALGARARVLELPPGVKDVSELGARPGGRETFFGLLDAERRGADAAGR
ncbi:MAG: CHC2 zinc finger domain-containing protein [Chloroflexi bacterium]|nr:CHC2 zinc finger domain-containing protein [Chloroflexota bacterium]